MRAKVMKRHMRTMSCSLSIIAVLLQTCSSAIATQSQSKSSAPTNSIDLLKPELPSSDSTVAQPTPKAFPSKAITDSSSSQNNSNVDANGPSSDGASAQGALTDATATPSISSAATRRILNGQVSKAGLKDSDNGSEGNAVLTVPDALVVPTPMNLNIDDLRAIDNPNVNGHCCCKQCWSESHAEHSNEPVYKLRC